MDYKFEFVRCNVCGSNNHHKISDRGQFKLPANVVICEECGLSFLNPRWDSDSYLQFYKNEYDKYYRPQLKKSIRSKQKPIDTINPIIKRFEEYDFVPGNIQNILDIGSGEGKNLKDFGVHFPKSNLHAIEPSESSQEYLKNLNINLLSDDANASWEEDCKGKFDIIIMRHVLEHFLNPLEILKKVKKVLSDIGVVYIAVPNNLNPTQNLKNRWFRAVHTYYFNKYSLVNLLTLSDLASLKIIEGDELNKGEVFLFAKHSRTKNQLAISKKHFIIQRDKFENILNRENKLINKVLSRPKRVLKKLISMIG